MLLQKVMGSARVPLGKGPDTLWMQMLLPMSTRPALLQVMPLRVKLLGLGESPIPKIAVPDTDRLSKVNELILSVSCMMNTGMCRSRGSTTMWAN